MGRYDRSLPELTGTVRVPLSRFARYEKHFTRSVVIALFEEGVIAAGDEVRELLEAESIRRGIWYKGRFARGWRVRKKKDRHGARAEVYNKAKYAIVVEKGRRRNRRPPPSNVLVPWVMAKLGMSQKEAKGVAFAIARAIGRRGIKGRPVLNTPRMRARIERILRNAAQAKMQAAMKRVRP